MPPDTTGGPAQTDTNAGSQTTESQSQQPDSANRSLMDLLDIPADVQSKIAPAGEQKPASEQQPTAEAPSTDAVSETETAEEEAGTQETDDEETEQEQEQEQKQGQEGKEQKIDKRQKRINRLTRQKAELETKLDAAVTENQQFRDYFGKLQQGQVRQQNAVPVGSGRLAHVMDEQQLGQEVGQAQAVIEWCDANADGVTTGEGDKMQFVEPNEIAKWRREAEKVVLNAPERRDQIRAFTAERTKYDQLAYQAWPELFDRSSKEHQVASQILAEFPGLAGHPQAAYALGLVVEGAKSLQARQKGNGDQGNGQQPAAGTRPAISPRAFEPRVPISPHTAGPPSRDAKPSATKKLNEARQQLVSDPEGGASSLAKIFAAMDEVSPNRGRRGLVKAS